MINQIENNPKFEVYFNYLIQENNKYNLTAITNKKDVYVKHFLDSLSLQNVFDLNQPIKICDIGSGAGFPGLPLKICYPNIDLTMIEPTTKRANFLKTLSNNLNVETTVINKRAEECVQEYSESFDICVARAVANTQILLELLIGFVKVGGYIFLYKGSKGIEELINSKNALKLLNCTCEQIYEYELSDDFGKRILIKIKKNGTTDKKYPRRYAEIKKKPL